ncbi:TPA: RusA family crossover junction endodeoxyribonuclease, partial [Enterococcus faecium]|nr:RusA family crossover junction endodeoxyribonuclease [Enterococcus faecium]
FYQVRKDKKKLDSLMRTSQPDIDNLVKGTLDGIFNKEIGIKDSRVVGLIAFKYNTFEKSKTNVRLQEMG